jgi:hypothetical protein
MRDLRIPTPPPALDPRTHGRFDAAPGVTAERVTYGTQYGMRIPAIMCRALCLPRKFPR